MVFLSKVTEKAHEGGLKGRVIWPRQEVTIRTIQRFCRGHLRMRVHADYLLPGRLIPGHTCFFQMLVWVCSGMYGVWFIEWTLFAMLTNLFPFWSISLASTSNPIFNGNRELRVSLALHWSRFQGYHTFSGFLAVPMVRSDFSMDIPIKITLNLQLHYIQISHLKWPSLKGTNTNYPKKSQLGRKDIK